MTSVMFVVWALYTKETSSRDIRYTSMSSILSFKDKLDPANRVLVAPVKARIQISWLVFPSALVMQIFAEAWSLISFDLFCIPQFSHFSVVHVNDFALFNLLLHTLQEQNMFSFDTNWTLWRLFLFLDF